VCSDVSLGMWKGIPAGSRAKVWLESLDDGWTANARSIDASSNEAEYSDAQLAAGKCQLTINPDSAFSVRVRVAFVSKATVRIHAAVEKPDGAGRYGTDYCYEVSGKKGTIKRATIDFVGIQS
jgi:hypothetical protein